ncbi:hypothetical protein BLOT_010362 [Blomia tropicalis]|nr:hypothetical protein BLOT_010362 [Blomia tropicalis]
MKNNDDDNVQHRSQQIEITSTAGSSRGQSSSGNIDTFIGNMEANQLINRLIKYSVHQSRIPWTKQSNIEKNVANLSIENQFEIEIQCEPELKNIGPDMMSDEFNGISTLIAEQNKEIFATMYSAIESLNNFGKKSENVSNSNSDNSNNNESNKPSKGNHSNDNEKKLENKSENEEQSEVEYSSPEKVIKLDEFICTPSTSKANVLVIKKQKNVEKQNENKTSSSKMVCETSNKQPMLKYEPLEEYDGSITEDTLIPEYLLPERLTFVANNNEKPMLRKIYGYEHDKIVMEKLNTLLERRRNNIQLDKYEKYELNETYSPIQDEKKFPFGMDKFEKYSLFKIISWKLVKKTNRLIEIVIRWNPTWIDADHSNGMAELEATYWEYQRTHKTKLLNPLANDDDFDHTVHRIVDHCFYHDESEETGMVKTAFLVEWSIEKLLLSKFHNKQYDIYRKPLEELVRVKEYPFFTEKNCQLWFKKPIEPYQFKISHTFFTDEINKQLEKFTYKQQITILKHATSNNRTIEQMRQLDLSFKNFFEDHFEKIVIRSTKRVPIITLHKDNTKEPITKFEMTNELIPLTKQLFKRQFNKTEMKFMSDIYQLIWTLNVFNNVQFTPVQLTNFLTSFTKSLVDVCREQITACIFYDRNENISYAEKILLPDEFINFNKKDPSLLWCQSMSVQNYFAFKTKLLTPIQNKYHYMILFLGDQIATEDEIKILTYNAYAYLEKLIFANNQNRWLNMKRLTLFCGYQNIVPWFDLFPNITLLKLKSINSLPVTMKTLEIIQNKIPLVTDLHLIGFEPVHTNIDAKMIDKFYGTEMTKWKRDTLDEMKQFHQCQQPELSVKPILANIRTLTIVTTCFDAFEGKNDAKKAANMHRLPMMANGIHAPNLACKIQMKTLNGMERSNKQTTTLMVEITM